MTVSFDTFMERLRKGTTLHSQTDIANALGVHRSAITQAKRRDMVPSKWILALSRSQGVSPDWLEFGTGPARPAKETDAPRERPFADIREYTGAVFEVPQVQARLCAGGGSFELEAIPVAQHPFPRSWLSRMGRPDAMVFMDVVGNSMEPGIADGDMVLVDQSSTDPRQRAVMAVGLEEAIYIKRLEQKKDGIVLLSDNPEYAPIPIRGDEADSFRIIGRVVWLCRDCRD